jgi:putative transposase
MMQTLGRQYVRYFNSRYQRTGTLWEGRYKSYLVQEEIHLLELYRYIELNPVRAGIVEQPSDYVWSSYAINALGKPPKLCTPHVLYMALGNERFKVEIEKLTGRRVTARKAGRSADWRKRINSCEDNEILPSDSGQAGPRKN